MKVSGEMVQLKEKDRNSKIEGKGIYYFHNGDRMMGDYYNGNPIGKHVTLTRNGEVKTYNY